MSRNISLPDPKRFNLESFADLLPERVPIIGEDPGSFDGFHEGMMRSLAPATPYEGVIAENLVAIEWELLQQRRMREAGLRKLIRDAIRAAVVARRKAEVEEELDQAFDDYVEKGGDEDDWEAPFEFEEEAAESEGEALAGRAVSRDRSEQVAALEDIAALGMEPVEIMAEAYRSLDNSVTRHEGKVQHLEGRRREVKRDYDALVKTRPIDGDVEVIEG